MAEKILKITSECIDSDYLETELFVEELITNEDFAKLVLNNIHGILPELLKNKLFTNALSNNGFKNVSDLKKIADNIQHTTEYYIYKNVNRYDRILLDVNLLDLDYYDALILADSSSKLVQTIKKDCLKDISKNSYDNLKKARKELRDKAEKKKEANDKKKEAKKQKEIEKAKKLLQESGEIV